MMRNDGGGIHRYQEETLRQFAQRLYETISDQMWPWSELSWSEHREWMQVAKARS